MDPVYVFGHKNPDTDAIVAAISYAALRNALGDREYVACRLGVVSDETNNILQRFGFEAPMRLYDVRTQVKDLDFDRPTILSDAVTVHRAWEQMSEEKSASASLPIADEKGRLFGMLTTGDIAQYDMRFVEETMLQEVPLFNLLSCLDGQIWGDSGDVTELSGELSIAVPGSQGAFAQGSIVITGPDAGVLQKAFESKARAVIVCGVLPPAQDMEHRGDTVVITTPFDPYRAARLMIQSVPVSRIARTEDLAVFHEDDYLDMVKDATLKSRYRSYPVLDSEDKVVGTLSRYHLLRPNRKKVVLVDHSETAQSVDGLEEAHILAIIDHHRLADVQTTDPIYVRTEPVGASTTIIATMFQERGIMPSQKLAGLMAAGILSDTILFQSPTCTERDKVMAERMARLAGLSLKELGDFIFATTLPKDADLKALLLTDFKEFQIAGHRLGIGQYTSTNTEQFAARQGELISIMEAERKSRDYDMLLFMLTDVLKKSTRLLAVGALDELGQAFNTEFRDNAAWLPGVMSRKKQIVPTLSLIWG
ncbi:MAG: putative manganese-dependent inorganic diphosphatase [Clostridia bacterium]|nr:putative manganese-dependent inorganic diphosphatase [Clostridia bacterium]